MKGDVRARGAGTCLVVSAQAPMEVCSNLAYCGLETHPSCAFEFARVGVTDVPDSIWSVPWTTISSPACRSPKTSISFPIVEPVFTSTHSARLFRTLRTKVRAWLVATAELGTNIVG